MDEDPTYPAPQRRPIVRKLPKEPSWLLLGFLLGAAFVWLLPKPAPKSQPRPAPEEGREQGPAEVSAGQAGSPEAASPKAAARKSAPLRRVTTIEAVFEAWGRYAVWEDGFTQVALWNPETGKFTEFYEVVRLADGYFYRSIPRLTRPVIDYGTQITSPLMYTETERTRAARARGEAPLPDSQPHPQPPRTTEELPLSQDPKPREASPPPPSVPAAWVPPTTAPGVLTAEAPTVRTIAPPSADPGLLERALREQAEEAGTDAIAKAPPTGQAKQQPGDKAEKSPPAK